MKQHVLLAVWMVTAASSFSNASAQGSSTGAVEIGQTYTIESKALQESRTIHVYVPPGYTSTAARYPVLYVLDGQNYFVPAVGVVRYLAMMDLLPEMLVVGIPSRDRLKEYTPTKDARSPSGGGIGPFLTFVNDELFPFIEGRYRTLPYRILSGHSLGGLCVLYAFVKRPEMFSAYIAISPSVYWDNSVLARIAEPAPNASAGARKAVYSSVEGPSDNLHTRTNAEFARLLNARAGQQLRYRFATLDRETHTSLWIKSFDDGLRFVSPWYVPEAALNGGLVTIRKYFEAAGYPLSESLLQKLAEDFYAAGKRKHAIEILEYMIAANPKSADTYHGLGDYCREDGQLERALAAYRKGLEMAQASGNRTLVELFTQHIDEIQKLMAKK